MIARMEIAFPGAGICDGEFTMKLLREALPRLGRFFRRFKETRIMSFAPKNDGRAPEIALPFKVHANVTGRVVALYGLIHAILASVSRAKIGESIIRSFTVDVIDAASTPLSSHHEPREHVRSVIVPLSDHDDEIAERIDRSGWLTGISHIPSLEPICSFSPSKDAGFRVISENGADVFESELSGHGASLAGKNTMGTRQLQALEGER